jgi:NAD(P)-dependent dehydrogenase (short-subunit alcohol dehydrogenase family)
MFESLIPRGKMGRPEEIATAARFLASDDSELREWGGVVCRRRLLGHLNRRGRRETRIGARLLTRQVPGQ